MTDTLARVHWKMGQSILPEFFVTQEDALIRDSILRFKSMGIPFYGISGLEWNNALLPEGVVSIKRMTLIMPSGQLLNVPENARVSPFNIGMIGSTNVSVYCHFVLDDKEGTKDTGGWQDDDTNDIPKVYYKLILSSQQSTQGIQESMKIAEFHKDPDEVWHLSDHYVPPLLEVGTTPFLEKKMDELSDVLEHFHLNLALEAAGYLSGDSLVNIKLCMKSAIKMQRCLANIKNQIHCHPYYFYETLNDFYVELCHYKKILPEKGILPYYHDQLAVCLNNLMDPLIDHMKSMEAKSPYLPFSFENGIFSLKLSGEIRENREVYFLVQKGHVGDGLDISNLKLGSKSRLTMIHRLALPGIPLKAVKRPPFQHSFGPEVEFFKIVEGEEWDHSLRDLSLAFYQHAQLENMEFFLYWR